MSSNADVHKMGLVPVTLMVLGNIMGLDALPLPVSLASIGGIAIYEWLVTAIGALGFSMVYARVLFLNSGPGGSYAYTRRCFGPFLGHQTDVLYWLAYWTGNVAMVVIGAGCLSYFLPILKDLLVSTITCIVALWIFALLNVVGPRMTTHVQIVATVLALILIVGIAVSSWFWLHGETYMAVWNASGLGTFGTVQSTLNITLWSFIGVGSAPVAADMVKSPKRNVPIATVGGVLAATVCYVLSTTVVMGMISNTTLCVSASPFGDATRTALGDTTGVTVSFCAATDYLGSLGGWTPLADQTAKAATDDGLFPPVFAHVNRAGMPVTGLTIVGISMIVFQLSSIPPNATKKSGLVSPVSIIFTLVSYPCTCVTLLLLGRNHFGKTRPTYLVVTIIAFLYCIRAVVGSGAKEVMWSFVTLMVITAMCTLNYNRLHESPYPLDTSINKD